MVILDYLHGDFPNPLFSYAHQRLQALLEELGRPTALMLNESDYSAPLIQVDAEFSSTSFPWRSKTSLNLPHEHATASDYPRR